MNLEKLRSHLSFLYGPDRAVQVLGQVKVILERYHPHTGRLNVDLSQRDVMLITYADQVTGATGSPLSALGVFCNEYLQGLVSAVHLLPFYPWTSDDGFSVVDYRQVAPEFGSWGDIQHFAENFQLMFDAVINHASISSEWFKGF